MCEIQFVKKLKDNLTKRDVNEFFELMKLGSLNNNCAYGFFNEIVFHKDEGMFNLDSFKDYAKVKQSNFIIGHNRYATTGDKKVNGNNHPFKLNDFTMVHNGVISNNLSLRNKFNIKSEIETDSYVILHLINHFFKQGRGHRKKNIITAIKKTAEKLEGSFSVMLYDNKEDNIFYFKNSKTYFSFCLLDNNILIGTTSEVNLSYIYTDKKFIFDRRNYKTKLIKEIEDNEIYLINDDVIIKSVGKFREKEERVWSDDWENEEDEAEFRAYNKSYGITDDMLAYVDDTIQTMLGYIPFYDLSKDKQRVIFQHNEILMEELDNCFADVIINKKGVSVPIQSILDCFA